MITFWILYSYLVPISLFVSLEIVKFWQGFLYINHDREMKVSTSHQMLLACDTECCARWALPIRQCIAV